MAALFAASSISSLVALSNALKSNESLADKNGICNIDMLDPVEEEADDDDDDGVRVRNPCDVTIDDCLGCKLIG